MELLIRKFCQASGIWSRFDGSQVKRVKVEIFQSLLIWENVRDTYSSIKIFIKQLIFLDIILGDGYYLESIKNGLIFLKLIPSCNVNKERNFNFQNCIEGEQN